MQIDHQRILGIETSCDDTGVAVYDSEQGLQANAIYSQVATHRDFGGVVPELAARDHIRKVVPLVGNLLSQHKIDAASLTAVAYTRGPGLAGALLAGGSVAKGLAYGWQIPAIGIHHMEGHLLAPMLEASPPEMPFIALLVSGGHTLLAEVRQVGDYRILGQSIDDAAGEAFDKTAKLLGLGYPGGPGLARAAENGDTERFQFPRPMVKRPGLDFSFSGLKTAALTQVQKFEGELSQQDIADIACAFQLAVVDTLVIKSERALKQSGLHRLVVAGGVAANKLLRERLDGLSGVDVYFPRLEFCTDNGAMIAYAGCQRAMQADKSHGLSIKPRWSLEDLPPLSV